jgi:hypothetical protein
VYNELQEELCIDIQISVIVSLFIFLETWFVLLFCPILVSSSKHVIWLQVSSFPVHDVHQAVKALTILNIFFPFCQVLLDLVYESSAQCHSFSVTSIMFATMPVAMTNLTGYQPAHLYQ